MKTSEIENIQKSLDIFVEGIRLLAYDKISEIFFDKGISCGVFQDQINYVYRDHWKEMREDAIAKGEEYISQNASYTIKSLNIIGNAASVIINLTFGTENKITERYIDFYHMLKVNNKWVIVNKIFPTNIERGRVD